MCFILLDWRTHNTALRKMMPGSYSSSSKNQRSSNLKRMSRRSIYNLLPYKQDIFKEHAKLVQDINGLKQVVFVPPLVDDNKDYDESIFHETIETFSTTIRPTITNLNRPTKKSSIPVILVGGASSNKLVKSQPFSFPKSTISLVGTTGSPLLKHPYPFVVEEPQKPLRVCMPTMALSTTTNKPSLWERLIQTLIPRRSFST